MFPNLSHRTRFNRTRRNLVSVIDAIRKEISKYLGYNQSDIYIVDSMPIPICGFGRAHFGKHIYPITDKGLISTYRENNVLEFETILTYNDAQISQEATITYNLDEKKISVK